MPMKKIRLLAMLLLATGILAQSARTQDSAKKAAAPSPATSPSAALIKQWNEIGRKLIDMAEDFPENKYDFKAASSVRTFAERLIHAAAANYYFTNLALGQKPPKEDDEPPISLLLNHLSGASTV